MPVVMLEGSNSGSETSGITIASSGSRVQGLSISGFSGAGIHVISGNGNTFSNNQIYGNGLLGIDLSGDGITPNDFSDLDHGPNDLINFPVLNRVIAGLDDTTIEGRFNGEPELTYQIELFTNETCDVSGNGEGQTFLDRFNVSTNDHGNALFSYVSDQIVQSNSFITATASGADGNTSEFSACIVSGNGNDSWTDAMSLDPDPGSGLPAIHFSVFGYSRTIALV